MIFYFTATGNSQYAAQKIAAVSGERTVNIADCVQNGQYAFSLADGEPLGLVAPVFFYGVPMIVTEFLQKLQLAAKPGYYSYAVLNCGGATADAHRTLRRVFPFDAYYGLLMVDNYVPLFKIVGKEEIEERLNKADTAAKEIAARVKARDKGLFNAHRGRFPYLNTLFGYPRYTRGRKTEQFTVNGDCTGCGLCESVCPRGAICWRDGRPAWVLPQCELCFACLHRCPVAAIDYGEQSAKNGRYLNPRVAFDQ